MSERLTIAEAQERAWPHCERMGASPDWTNPHAEADHFVAVAAGWGACRNSLLAIAAALRAYARHLDYEAGAKAERDNAAALLRQQAARFERVDAWHFAGPRERCEAKAAELRTMAAYIERGDRAEDA